MKFRVTSPYGALEEFRDHPHSGVDLSMPIGTDVLSPVEGVVQQIVNYGNENIGKGVIVQTDDGKEVIFGHLNEIHTKVGEHISIGEKIAESGNTGFSTGPHLHLGMKDSAGGVVDPQPVIDVLQGDDWFDKVKDFILQPSPITEWLKDIGFSLIESEVFFLIPAVILVTLRLMIGKNFTSGWILPLLYGFFVTQKF
jgi:Peptidase family M23